MMPINQQENESETDFKLNNNIDLYATLGELYYKYNELTDHLKMIESNIAEIMEQIKLNLQ